MSQSPRNGAPVWVGVDVGGTKVLAAVVGEDGSLGRVARRSTPGRSVEPRQVEDALTEAVLEAADGAPLAGVGLAAAGFVDATGQRVVFAPHLPWRSDPVRDRLSEHWGTPVVLENDATCALVAEAEYGAARGARSVVLVTMGTGIGGALMLDGRVVRGAGGMAGEFGHMQVVPDGAPCECGGQGCWEQYSSGNALLRAARSSLGASTSSGQAGGLGGSVEPGPTLMEQMCEGNPARLTGPMVTEAAAQGDLVARRAFAVVGDWLGVGLANLVAALDPELLVVGGGVSAAGDRLLEPARQALSRSLVAASHRVVPPVLPAALGPEAGLIGAAVLCRRRVLGGAQE